MHGCGHDGHTAMLVGAARYLAETRQFDGTAVLIFQPGEEGFAGAKAMIEAGALKDVQAIYGLHITSNLPGGVVGYRSGPLMAGSDNITIHVEGRGGHGSSPWATIDPIVAASQVVMGLQTVVSRQLNISQEPAVVTIGQIQGGTRYNIIPDKVEMLGTLRTFDEDMRQEALKRITATAESIAAASGAKASVRFGPVAYPVTTNPAQLTQASLPALNLAMGGKTMVIPKVAAPRTSRSSRRSFRASSTSWARHPRARNLPRPRPTTLRCSTSTRTSCPPAHAAWPRWPWTFCSASKKKRKEDGRRAAQAARWGVASWRPMSRRNGSSNATPSPSFTPRSPSAQVSHGSLVPANAMLQNTAITDCP